MRYTLIDIIPPKSDAWYDCYEATAIYEDGGQMYVYLSHASYADYVLRKKLDDLGVLNQVEKELNKLLELTRNEVEMEMQE